MFTYLAAQAFIVGIVSACSFPLGALTAAVWKPTDWALAFLLAFGGGTLLAALTLDLVGSALAKGQFSTLALGCVTGGLLFFGLNQLVNDYGGFLRKTSTALYYLRHLERRKLHRILAQVGRIGIFRNLPPEAMAALAGSVASRDYPKGARLYHQGDPSGNLYIIEQGTVDLLDPQAVLRLIHTAQPNDAFGRMAFLTGTP